MANVVAKDYQAAIKAYTKGLALEPGNTQMAQGVRQAQTAMRGGSSPTKAGGSKVPSPIGPYTHPTHISPPDGAQPTSSYFIGGVITDRAVIVSRMGFGFEVKGYSSVKAAEAAWKASSSLYAHILFELKMTPALQWVETKTYSATAISLEKIRAEARAVGIYES
jgi:hypothetical protein